MATATIPGTAHANPWAITLSRPAFDLFVGPDGSPTGRTWEQLIGDVSALRTLPADWDGQGAEAPPPAVVDGAVSLARGFQTDGAVAADRAIAGANGTVFFEWHGSNGYVEIEVTGPQEAEGRWVPNCSANVAIK